MNVRFSPYRTVNRVCRENRSGSGGADRGWGTGATSRKPLCKNATDIAADDLLDLLTPRIEGLSQRRGQQCQLRGVNRSGDETIEVGAQSNVIEWVVGRI